MKYLMILFYFLFFQVAYSQEEAPAFSTKLYQPGVFYPLLHPLPDDQNTLPFLSVTIPSTYLMTKPLPTLNHLPGMFCKMEYQLEKKSKLAPRFRLGSLYYTEWMEGKRDFYARYY